MLGKQNHKINQTKISVSRWQRPEQKTLKVSGLAPSANGEMIELYFENEKKSGGGSVTKVQMLEEGSALVTFQEEEGEIMICLHVHGCVCVCVCVYV